MVSQHPVGVTECSISGGPNPVQRKMLGSGRVDFQSSVSSPRATRLLIVFLILGWMLVLYSLDPGVGAPTAVGLYFAMWAARYWCFVLLDLGADFGADGVVGTVEKRGGLCCVACLILVVTLCFMVGGMCSRLLVAVGSVVLHGVLVARLGGCGRLCPVAGPRLLLVVGWALVAGD